MSSFLDLFSWGNRGEESRVDEMTTSYTSSKYTEIYSSIENERLRTRCEGKITEGQSLGSRSADLINFAFENFVEGSGSLSVSDRVLWQLVHASEAYKVMIESTFYIEQGSEFGFIHLDEVELLDLYNIIKAYNEDKKGGEKETFLTVHEFDIKDEVLRRCISGKGREVLEYTREKECFEEVRKEAIILTGDDDSYHDFNPIFHGIINTTEGLALTKLSEAKIFPHLSFEAEPESKEGDSIVRPLKVVKLALETERDSVGGISAVLRASRAAHKVLGMEKVRGVYPFYGHHKGNLTVKFKGILPHEYKGEILYSSVYKDVEAGNYLVKPPPGKYRSVFDVGKGSNVYGELPYSHRQDRYLFMASAAGAFCSLYSGKTGKKSIDVVQADAWHVGGPAFELMATRMDHLRTDSGLKRPRRVYLSHILIADRYEQGKMPEETLRRIGADPKLYSGRVSGGNVVQGESGLMLSDARAFVSEGVRNDAVAEDKRISMGLQKATLHKEEGTVFRPEEDVIGITNGIDTSVFDVMNEGRFGGYTLKKTFEITDEGNRETTDYLTHQKKIKEDLCEAGIIPDKEKLLFLFIGRYSSEKGIDMLPDMIEEVRRQGGQCVVMGLHTGDSTASSKIEALKIFAAKESNKDFIRVYDDLHKDQLNLFVDKSEKEHDVRKGWLIRAASSVVMVPSHAEACGLVPMEAHCTGALVVAPYIQGMRDMCTPIGNTEITGREYSLLDGGNSVTYTKSRDKGGAQAAIRQAAEALKALDPEQRNTFMRKTHDAAVKKYGWVNFDEHRIPRSGAAMKYSRLYHDVYHRERECGEVENFDQAYRRIERAFEELRKREVLEREALEIQKEMEVFKSIDHRLTTFGEELQKDLMEVFKETYAAKEEGGISRWQLRAQENLMLLVGKIYGNALPSEEMDPKDPFFSEAQELLREVVGLLKNEKRNEVKKAALMSLVSQVERAKKHVLAGVIEARGILEPSMSFEAQIKMCCEKFKDETTEKVIKKLFAGEDVTPDVKKAVKGVLFFDLKKEAKEALFGQVEVDESASCEGEEVLIPEELSTLAKDKGVEDLREAIRGALLEISGDGKTFNSYLVGEITTSEQVKESYIMWWKENPSPFFRSPLGLLKDEKIALLFELFSREGKPKSSFVSQFLKHFFAVTE
jgi:glycogen synthase